MKRLTSMLAAAVLGAGAALFLAPSAHALTYSEPNLDCMLCFRQAGTANPYDLEVDLGSVTNFYAVPIGNTISIANYTVAQLQNAMASSTFDNVEFSVCACDYSHSSGNDLNYPRGTMWVTLARFDVNTQSSPFARSTAPSLVSACSVILNLGGQATFYSGAVSPDPLANTATAVAIPPPNSASCENYIGPGNNSNLNGKFTENIGQFAPSPFSAAIRSDFYVDYPIGSPDPLNGNATSGNVSLVGYFTFNPDGTMRFTRTSNSTPPAPPPPPNLSVSRSGTLSTISFVSSNSATYQLFFTNSAGLIAPVSNWPSLPGTVTGDGTTKSFQDTTTDPNRFYRVMAH